MCTKRVEKICSLTIYTRIFSNVAAYACYELGSLLLDRDASGDGLGLLEKSIAFPIHEFQTRLKFVVGERLKRFH